MQQKEIPLANLELGRQAVVTQIALSAKEKQRYLNLGLVEGTPITALHRSPWGDPTAYFFRGAVVALRRSDSAAVLVNPLIGQ